MNDHSPTPHASQAQRPTDQDRQSQSGDTAGFSPILRDQGLCSQGSWT
jgi:hypothetical protein